MIDREEDCNGMSREKEIFQCNCCGNIYKVDERYKPKGDNVYETLWCQQCGEYTRQLYCGDNLDDLYMLCDINIDPRMY